MQTIIIVLDGEIGRVIGGDYALKKSDREKLPFTHLSKMSPRPREFEGDVLKRNADYALVHPDRQFILQLVKFAPGMGPQDWVDFHKDLNDVRHTMDIHEIATFLTWGEFDMIVLWDAKDLKTYNEFLALTINPKKHSYGRSHSHPVAMTLGHPGN